MTAAILEIRDGVATGPLHQPVKANQGGSFNEKEPPLTWEALCGVRGYVYQRASLVALGHSTECWGCQAATAKKRRRIYNPGPAGGKYATEEQRRAARLASYNSYYQRKKAREAA